MPLIKTEKALIELRSRGRMLGLKERALLLVADGKKSAGELQTLVQADAALVEQLVTQGFLVRPPGKTTPVAKPPQTAPAAKPPQTAPDAKPPQVSADPFHGNRSLATARLYLLDMSERMFARPDPAFAQSLREQLRSAPDQEAVRAAADTLLQQVETMSGPARAESIRVRLDLLLPTAPDFEIL